MDFDNLCGLLTHPENQPHQYVDRLEDLKNDMTKAVLQAATPDTSALREAHGQLTRYDESLASRYSFLSEGGANEQRLNDIACERVGIGKCLDILEALAQAPKPASS